jgi:hypothetical protein
LTAGHRPEFALRDGILTTDATAQIEGVAVMVSHPTRRALEIVIIIVIGGSETAKPISKLIPTVRTLGHYPNTSLIRSRE